MAHEHTLIVYTSPRDGREAEYNDWYDHVHLPEFSALPGVITGRRYKVTSPTPDGKPTYAAVYELSVGADEVLAAMNAGIKDGTMHMSDAVDGGSITMVTLTPR